MFTQSKSLLKWVEYDQNRNITRFISIESQPKKIVVVVVVVIVVVVVAVVHEVVVVIPDVDPSNIPLKFVKIGLLK